METVTIRDARTGDLDAIADLQARAIMTFGIETYGQTACEAWARLGRQMRHRLLASGSFFVAEGRDGLVGVAGWTADSRDPDCAWPRYVFVAPEAAGHGIGRRLMEIIERSALEAARPRLRLWSSLNAVAFYRALGYDEVKPARWPVAEGIEMEHRLMEKRAAPSACDRRSRVIAS
ncbi:MAG: GNAT family N-acetyltransferase [Alphaproteobacteria bacterium]